MTTYGEALANARAALNQAGIANAGLDARLLLAAAAGLDMAALLARDGDALPAVARATFDDHMRRRLKREPVARILGEKDFWGLPFQLGAATLVPRPETEALVEVVLREIAERFPPDLAVADLGTGSGAIAIALLKELPRARVVATDISDQALSMALRNAERLGVAERITLTKVDFAEGPEGPVHVVVANPPYIRSGMIDSLTSEVREHDPRAALDGGPDGLAAYRAILGRVDSLLMTGGLVAFEVGADQGEPVAALCREAGLGGVCVSRDLAGRERVVSAIQTKPTVALERKKSAWKSGAGRLASSGKPERSHRAKASIYGR